MVSVIYRCALASLFFALTVATSARAQTFAIDTKSATDGPMSGAWYNANESGWGVLLSQRADIMFAAMFTYDDKNVPTWYIASACLVARDSCSGEFFVVNGGVSPVVPWANVNLSVQKVGIFTMKFTDASTGQVSYTINGANGSKAITRLTWAAQQTPAGTITWEKSSDLNTNMPVGIEVFRGEAGSGSTGLRAWFATLDRKLNPALEWAPQSIAPGAKTASDFAKDEPKRAYVVANAGYFGASTINQSFSLIIKAGALAAPGVKQLTRSGATYFPTRAAFGELANGNLIATWAYPVGTANTVYSYPLPASNDSAKAPKAAPDASFPPGGNTWSPSKAIGGGPMLLLNGAKVVTATEEVFDAASGVSPGSGAPRTAIARLKDDRVALIVVDGRSSVSRGVSLNELADILLSLGAVDAMNLDGGGSTTMVVNGVLVNAPSDGVQRAIPSVVMFREK
jgi:hypothetical protein